ncbi:putative anthranilate synthase [Helianthus anomalus]
MCPTVVGSDGYPFLGKFNLSLNLEKMPLSDEKQCAEHAMLVDLGRNDVGKVTKPGSVNVEKHMTVKRYSHVMHISSIVRHYYFVCCFMFFSITTTIYR